MPGYIRSRGESLVLCSQNIAWLIHFKLLQVVILQQHEENVG